MGAFAGMQQQALAAVFGQHGNDAIEHAAAGVVVVQAHREARAQRLQVAVRRGDKEGAQRRIQLLAGEIFIATGKDAAQRPFFVDTPHGSLQALGTRFTVRLHEQYASAGVLEGAVAVLAGDGAQLLVLRPGEGAHFDGTGAHRQALAPYGGAWLDGMLVARDMRLADFLAELSRYSDHPLGCTPAVASLRVSGSYPLADVDAILDAVSASLRLRRNTVTRFWGHQVVRIELAAR